MVRIWLVRSFCLCLFGCSSSFPEEIRRETNTSFGKISYLSSECNNQKKLLVILHGSPGTANDYKRYFLDPKLHREYCLLIPDRLGFGQSENSKAITTLHSHAMALEEWISAWEFQTKTRKPLVVMAHSYGGPILLEWMKAQPKRFAEYSTAVFMAAPLDPYWEKPAWYNTVADSKFVRWILPKSLQFSNDEMMALPKELERLSEIKDSSLAKVILVHGDEDSLVPFAHIHYLDGRPNVTKYPLNGKDHFIPWTEYSYFQKLLLELP